MLRGRPPSLGAACFPPRATPPVARPRPEPVPFGLFQPPPSPRFRFDFRSARVRRRRRSARRPLATGAAAPPRASPTLGNERRDAAAGLADAWQRAPRRRRGPRRRLATGAAASPGTLPVAFRGRGGGVAGLASSRRRRRRRRRGRRQEVRRTRGALPGSRAETSGRRRVVPGRCEAVGLNSSFRRSGASWTTGRSATVEPAAEDQPPRRGARDVRPRGPT